ncbi:MAG: diguanylate cyclase [Desulfitobacteriaceae bacterium]|nr:diguanylate cyclase [Desulfitobacteriaceae bacterium]MDD4753468.1 diguanylate cyclase [Desulfitobacteriaceae bacterium]
MWDIDSQQVLDMLPLPTCVIKDDIIQYANFKLANLLHYSPTYLKSLSFLKMVHPQERLKLKNFITQFVNKNSGTERCQFRVETGRGDVLCIKAVFSLLNQNPGTGVICQCCGAIRYEHQSLDGSIIQEEESDKVFREIFHHSPIGMAFFDKNGLLTDANQASLEILGLTSIEALKGCNLLANSFLPESIKEKIRDGESLEYSTEFDCSLVGESKQLPFNKTRYCHIDYLVTAIKTKEKKCAGYLVQIQDITARTLAERHLQYLSLHDSLTGCYNRGYFEQEMKRVEGGRLPSPGIILFDIDELKLINDTMGHLTGDNIIVTASHILKNCFRVGDVVARIGGDEFGVIIPNGDQATFEGVCQRINKMVAEHNEANPHLPLAISMGYAIMDISEKSMDQLFKEADDNLYRQKLSRRTSVHNAFFRGLTRSLEARDFFAQGHNTRLKYLVRELAKTVSLPLPQINNICLLAQFHDIGKVAVLENILMKPSYLNCTEMQEVHRHCEIGHRIALASPELFPIAELILKHHEWWNGGGYPLGLKEEEIPLECRIFSIAEAYDVMTNDRPYRKALCHDDAVKELLDGAGVQFDPELVTKFIRIIKEGCTKEESKPTVFE